MFLAALYERLRQNVTPVWWVLHVKMTNSSLMLINALNLIGAGFFGRLQKRLY